MKYEIRKSIPKLICGGEIATAFMVSDEVAITAKHAIVDFVMKEDPIYLVFMVNNKEKKVAAKPLLVDKNSNEEIIALKLDEKIGFITPLKCADYKFETPLKCETFGYPPVRTGGTPSEVHVIYKVDAESYEELSDGWNLDLKKDDDIKNFSGLSGGPLLLNNCVIGVILKQATENCEASRLSGVSLDLYKNYFQKLDLDLNSIKCNDMELDSKYIDVGIRSFEIGTENMHQETKKMLCLLSYFDDGYIKDKYNWNNDIYLELKNFAKDFEAQYKYKLHLDTHLSISFTFGSLLYSKVGIEIYPMQKIGTGGKKFWKYEENFDEENFDDWVVTDDHIQLGDVEKDVALILGIRQDIEDDVISYIKGSEIKLSKIINCSVGGKYGDNVIIDGSHAKKLVNNLELVLKRNRTLNEKMNKLHIFVSCPVAFMFYLGQVSGDFGKVILYEYNRKNRINGSYFPSFELPAD